ncbi:hypothetical protein Tco_0348734 [Tanacetum coccineum]
MLILCSGSWSVFGAEHLGALRGTEVTLKGLKRKDVQLLRKFGIQFKGGFENAEVGGDPKYNSHSMRRMQLP